MDVDTQWIAVENLHFKFSDGAANTSAHVNVTANNFSWLNCDITGASNGTSSIAGVQVDGVTGFSMDGGTLTDLNTTGIRIIDGATGTFDNLTMGTFGQAGAQGDSVSGENTHTGTITFNDCTWDNSDDNSGEESLDTKGSGTWTFNRCTWSASRNGILVGVNSAVTITFNDCTFKMTTNPNSNRPLAFGAGGVSTSSITLNRCIIHDVDSTSNLIRIGGGIGDNLTVTFNACALELPTGSNAVRLIEIRRNCPVVLDNCTLITRNGNTATEIILVNANYVGSGVTIRNSILDMDGTTGFLLESDVADPFTLDQNLYESANTGNWVDINGTTYTEATLISTYDTSGSDTGAPDFASEDDASDDYLLPNSGSPAIDLGDATHTPAGGDLKGTSYGTPPNSGCRAGNA
jgi:hypothetical protein